MSGSAPESTAREILAVSLKLLGVPTDDERLAQLEEKVAALLEDGERLSARVAPEIEPLVVLRLPGSEREGGR
jgi:hypothetical protein